MKRRNFFLGLGSLAGGVTVGTGAFSAARVDRENDITVTNDADALLGLKPNPEIAGVDLHDGQLAISLSDPGINVNSAYQFGAFVEDDISEETVRDHLGDLFDPVLYDERGPGFTPDNFRSAFMLINQTDEPVNIEMSVDITDHATHGEPQSLFQIHQRLESEGHINPNSAGGSVKSAAFPLHSGEAHGVSFAIDTTESEVEDRITAEISVDARAHEESN